MRSLLWILGLALLASASCNYDEGACWIDGEGDGNVGAGGGPIAPGWGGYGDVPPQPQDTADPPPTDCALMGGFSASLFKFTKTQEDDGVGFGWQEAQPTLKFADGRQDPTATWTCTINVGMPLRTGTMGKIAADWAAETSAGIATEASGAVMRSQSSWIPAAFCKTFKDQMNSIFGKRYPNLGARVTYIK